MASVRHGGRRAAAHECHGCGEGGLHRGAQSKPCSRVYLECLPHQLSC
jgi:hypothetical protein